MTEITLINLKTLSGLIHVDRITINTTEITTIIETIEITIIIETIEITIIVETIQEEIRHLDKADRIEVKVL